MKIVVLANADSVHTRKWITSLCRSGIEIVLVSLHDFDRSVYEELPGFSSYTLGFDSKLNYFDKKFFKLKYLTAVKKIKKIIDAEKPGILHAYYASSFGLMGAMCNFHPYIISVWGSDIFEFPLSSFVAKKILKSNLAKADYIFATSNALALETKKYCLKEITVIPFGIDVDVFFRNRKRTLFAENDIVIGTIKTFEKVYGIEYLIQAFAKVCSNNTAMPLKLMLVGKGSCENEYKALVKKLGIEQNVLFTGYVNHTEIAKYYNNLDIFVVPSIRESFGVSALEASACELPVIASNTGGLPEVVVDKDTGFWVPSGDTDALANTMEKLIVDENLRLSLGKNGRQFVVEKYSWANSVEEMINTYQKILQS